MNINTVKLFPKKVLPIHSPANVEEPVFAQLQQRSLLPNTFCMSVKQQAKEWSHFNTLVSKCGSTSFLMFKFFFSFLPMIGFPDSGLFLGFYSLNWFTEINSYDKNILPNLSLVLWIYGILIMSLDIFIFLCNYSMIFVMSRFYVKLWKILLSHFTYKIKMFNLPQVFI